MLGSDDENDESLVVDTAYDADEEYIAQTFERLGLVLGQIHSRGKRRTKDYCICRRADDAVLVYDGKTLFKDLGVDTRAKKTKVVRTVGKSIISKAIDSIPVVGGILSFFTGKLVDRSFMELDIRSVMVFLSKYEPADLNALFEPCRVYRRAPFDKTSSLRAEYKSIFGTELYRVNLIYRKFGILPISCSFSFDLSVDDGVDAVFGIDDSKKKRSLMMQLTDTKPRTAAERAAHQRAYEDGIEQLNTQFSEPFDWETEMPDLPNIQRLSPKHEVDDQGFFDAYVCSNREFWKAFHYSRNLEESRLGGEHFVNLRALSIGVAKTDLPEILSVLNVIYVLKGEYPLAYGGFTLLTNYRLMVNYNGWWNIPIPDLKTYRLENNGLTVEWVKDGTDQQLSLRGQCLSESIVHSAMISINAFGLDQFQLFLLRRLRDTNDSRQGPNGEALSMNLFGWPFG